MNTDTPVLLIFFRIFFRIFPIIFWKIKWMRNVNNFEIAKVQSEGAA